MSTRNGSNGSTQEKLLVFEANMDAALRSHYRRGGDAVDSAPVPGDQIMDVDLGNGRNGNFIQALLAEDDGISGGENGPGNYEMCQRVATARAIYRFTQRRGATLPQIMREYFACGRAFQDPFCCSLTMTEAGLMFSETKAAHSWRCKVLSGEIKLAGMKGTRLPGQKSPESSESYRAVAMGNKNRSRKSAVKRQVQGSFLRQFQSKKGKRAKQKSFMRKLNA